MRQNIKVSVILTTYNCEKRLRKCIDSIINQTLRDIEIICVDDCSTDNSVEIVREYEKEDDRISVIALTKNSGNATLPRNIGIKKAAGEYLSILDGDDFFELNMLSEMYANAKQNDSDIVICDYSTHFIDTQRIVRSKPRGANPEMVQFFKSKNIFSPNDCPDFAVFANPIEAAWNMMVRRSFCEENNIYFCLSLPHIAIDDNNFVFLAILCASRISFVRQSLVNYIKVENSGQYYTKLNRVALSSIEVLLRLIDDLKIRGIYEKFERGILNKLLNKIIMHLGFIGDSVIYELSYNELKIKVLNAILNDKIDSDYFFLPGLYDKLNDILRNDAISYLLSRSLGKDSHRKKRKQVIECLKSKKIILYGFGDCGKNWFYMLLHEKDISILMWVDTYEKNNFVDSPERITSCIDYDCIIIAVLNYGIFVEIRDYLLSLNVPENKIIWSEESERTTQVKNFLGDNNV